MIEWDTDKDLYIRILIPDIKARRTPKESKKIWMIAAYTAHEPTLPNPLSFTAQDGNI